jgi:hypothetical protein
VISAELADFLQSGISILVGTRDADLIPDCARGVGVRVEPGGAEVTLFVPVATGAATIGNLEDNGRLAVTFSRPVDHRSIQLKGSVVEIRAAVAGERAEVESYRLAYSSTLGYIGLPPRLTARVRNWPCHALRLRVEALYQQTPGPDAGVAYAAGGAPS